LTTCFPCAMMRLPTGRLLLSSRETNIIKETRAREDEIFAVAARLFRERGYHATSMSEIARAVGLQKASLYHYVSGKEDFLFQTSQKGILALNQAVDEIVHTALPADEKLKRAIAAHVQILCQNMDWLAVFLRERRALPAKQQTEILAEGKRYEKMIQQILQEGVEAGLFRPVDVVMTSYALLGATNWLHQWFRLDGRLSPEEIAEIFIDLFFVGLLAEEGSNKTRRNI